MLAISRAFVGGLQRSPAAWTNALRKAYATVDTSGNDTHDDFKPKYKGEPVKDANATIESDVTSHDVFIYMKGVPEAPSCGFSNMACRILDAYGVKYGARNVLADAAIREGIKKYTSWPTIPQVFVKGDFIGGADILMSMHESGELEKTFGPIVKQQQQQKQ